MTDSRLDNDLGIYYRLCPRCSRAVPESSSEAYCINDGERLIHRCPKCKTRIKNPYARFCTGCGLAFASLFEKPLKESRVTQSTERNV